MVTQADGTWYGVSIGHWIILSMVLALGSVGTAAFLTWRSNLNSRRALSDQLERGWQQTVRQLKHEAEQRGKQRAHEAEQLDAKRNHDTEQRLRERESAFRLPVLMEAAGALLKLHTLIVRAANTDCAENELWDCFTESQARVVQLHMVAAEATVEAVMVYLNEIAPAFLEIFAMRRNLRYHEADRNQDGTMTDVASLNQNERRLELGSRAIVLSNQSGQSLASSLLALRAELGGPLDPRRYDQLWQVLVGKMEVVLKQELQDLKRLVGELRDALRPIEALPPD